MGGVWSTTYAWWNHLYECWVGPLAWDLGKISKALMNIKLTLGLKSATHDNNKIYGGVLW